MDGIFHPKSIVLLMLIMTSVDSSISWSQAEFDQKVEAVSTKRRTLVSLRPLRAILEVWLAKPLEAFTTSLFPEVHPQHREEHHVRYGIAGWV